MTNALSRCLRSRASYLAEMVVGFLPTITTVSHEKDLATITLSHAHGNGDTPLSGCITVPKRYVHVIAPKLAEYITWRSGHFPVAKIQHTISIETEGFYQGVILSLARDDFSALFNEVLLLGLMFSNGRFPTQQSLRFQKRKMQRIYRRLRFLAKIERNNPQLLPKEEKRLLLFFALAQRSVERSMKKPKRAKGVVTRYGPE